MFRDYALNLTEDAGLLIEVPPKKVGPFGSVRGVDLREPRGLPISL